MARTVNISFNIDTIKAVGNVATLNKELKNTKKAVDALNGSNINIKTSNSTKELLDVNNALARTTNGASSANTAFNTLIINMQKISVISNSGNTSVTNFGNGLDDATKKSIAFSTAMDAMNNVVGSLSFVMRAIGKDIDEFLKLEKAIYSLGVVSGKSNAQIKELRYEMLELAKGTPFTAVETTKAIDDVVRTGQTLKGAMDIVKASGELAVASGEKLSDAVEIVNKVMVALKVNTNQTNIITNEFHATAVSTATDLASLGVAVRQYGGALGGVASLSRKSGSELDNYRVQLVKLGTTFSGILANVGRAPEQAGENCNNAPLCYKVA